MSTEERVPIFVRAQIPSSKTRKRMILLIFSGLLFAIFAALSLASTQNHDATSPYCLVFYRENKKYCRVASQITFLHKEFCANYGTECVKSGDSDEYCTNYYQTHVGNCNGDKATSNTAYDAFCKSYDENCIPKEIPDTLPTPPPTKPTTGPSTKSPANVFWENLMGQPGVKGAQGVQVGPWFGSQAQGGVDVRTGTAVEDNRWQIPFLGLKGGTVKQTTYPGLDDIFGMVRGFTNLAQATQ